MADWLDEAVALVLVIGCLALLGLGVDGEVKSILVMAAGWAFGSGFMRMRNNKRR